MIGFLLLIFSETQALALVPYIEQNVLPIHKSHRQFEFLGKKLTILQDWGKLGVAAVVWDAVSTLRVLAVIDYFNHDGSYQFRASWHSSVMQKL